MPLPSVDTFPGFCLRYLLHYMQLDIPQFHRELYTLIPQHTRVAYACPRDFAKSTLVSIFYPLYLAMHPEKIPGRDKEIILLSATQALAKKWLAKIDKELLENELLVDDFGNMHQQKGKVWNQEQIELPNGVSIRAKGRHFQIRGEHPGVLIIDDLEQDDKVLSPDQRAKLEDWFWKVIDKAVRKDSQLLMIGTIMHPESLLNKIIHKEGPKRDWFVKLYKALQDDHTSLWPAKLSVQELEDERDANPYVFESERQNNPLSDGVTIIKPDMVCTYDTKPDIVETYMAVDPAFSEKVTREKDTDYTAVAVVGISREGVMYDIFSCQGRWNAYETVRRVKEMNDIYKPRFIGIEAGAQKVMLDIFRNEAPLLPVVPLKPEGKNKVQRLQTVMHVFTNHLYRSNNKAFWNQCLMFPSGQHDDMVDAAVYAVGMILKYEKLAQLKEKKIEKEDRKTRLKRRDAWIRKLKGEPSDFPGKQAGKTWVKSRLQ